MRLVARHFNRFLGKIGQNFLWRKSFACPCVNPKSGQADPKCPQCKGKGRVWTDPVEGVAGVVSRNWMWRTAEFGIWDKDDVMLSIPENSALYAIGQYDKVLSLHRSEPFSYNLIRGINDRIDFPIVSIERVYCLDNGHPVELPPPALEDGFLKWESGGPPEGATYSFTGRRRPEYFCYVDLPADRPMEMGEPLPRRVVLRRFDLFGR
jgi:hypothetical protein